MQKKKEFLMVEMESVRPTMNQVVNAWEIYQTNVSSLQIWLNGAEKVLNIGTADQKSVSHFMSFQY